MITAFVLPYMRSFPANSHLMKYFNMLRKLSLSGVEIRAMKLSANSDAGHFHAELDFGGCGQSYLASSSEHINLWPLLPFALRLAPSLVTQLTPDMNNPQGGHQHVKLVVLGDGATGKTCLLIAATTGAFPQEYVPTVFDNYTQNMFLDNNSYGIGLWDTAGGEDYDRLRPLSYPQTDVFFLCFSCVNPTSRENIVTKWVPEISHHMPGVPFVLVGTKCDLRDDGDMLDRLAERGMRPSSYEEGVDLATRVGAAFYHETSAKQGIGLDTLFQSMIRHCIIGTPAPKKRRHPGARMALCALM